MGGWEDVAVEAQGSGKSGLACTSTATDHASKYSLCLGTSMRMV
jgi:hypothetical protein